MESYQPAFPFRRLRSRGEEKLNELITATPLATGRGNTASIPQKKSAEGEMLPSFWSMAALPAGSQPRELLKMGAQNLLRFKDKTVSGTVPIYCNKFLFGALLPILAPLTPHHQGPLPHRATRALRLGSERCAQGLGGNSQEWSQHQGPGLLPSASGLFALHLGVSRNTGSAPDPKSLPGVWGQVQRPLLGVLLGQFSAFQRPHTTHPCRLSELWLW